GRHIDLVGIRGPNSYEGMNGSEFLLDKRLFDAISEFISAPKEKYIGIACEVTLQNDEEPHDQEKMDYVRAFLGPTPTVGVLVANFSQEKIFIDRGFICITARHATNWILTRIEEMDATIKGLSKSGSWT